MMSMTENMCSCSSNGNNSGSAVPTRNRSRSAISSVLAVGLAVTVSLNSQVASAFMIGSSCRALPTFSYRTPHLSVLFSNNNSNDDSNDNESAGGAELAAEFNEFIKLKELQDKLIAGEEKANKKSTPQQEKSTPQQSTSTTAQTQKQPPFFNRKEVRVDKNGKPYDVTPRRGGNNKSAGLFTTNPPVSLFSSPSERAYDNRQNNNVMPMTLNNLDSSELRLVRRAEIGLAVQMIVALIFLTGLVVVGINGGITDGSERFGNGFGEFMDMPDFSIITDGSDIVPETIGATSAAAAENIWI